LSRNSVSQELSSSDDAKGLASITARKTRWMVIGAALLALFLGAMDALVVGAAMPTVVAELGGLHLYSWVFSAYLLTRAISLPIFGKLCDLISSKKLYLVAITVFLLSSVLAGAAQSMEQLIIFRALQGIGAGGNFALAYIVVADISAPWQRGKMMGLISFVWGIASVTGPAIGGFIVAYFSWRWIFYINIPLGSLALYGIAVYLIDLREKKQEVWIDYWGAATLSLCIFAVLIIFMVGGRSYNWMSPQILILLIGAAVSGFLFYHVEKRAKEPIINLDFFRLRGFSMANGAAFFSSFAIFSLSAYVPLFIQGALGRTPAQLGVAMIPLSLGWSVGALLCGQLIDRSREKPFSLFGALLLLGGSAALLTFDTATSLFVCSAVLAVAGLGMGFVSIGTLLMVQDSLSPSNLGVATSSHQFSRTLGGTIGIGASGGLVTVYLTKSLEGMMAGVPHEEVPLALFSGPGENIQNLFRPELQAMLSAGLQKALQEAVDQGLDMVFWVSAAAALFSLVLGFLLPNFRRP